MSTAQRRWWLSPLLVVLLSSVLTVPPVEAAVTPATSASELANAIAPGPGLVTGASYVTVPGSGTSNAVADNAPALAAFPRHGGTFAILTSGNASLADDPNNSSSSGADAGGAAVRGGALDTTILKVDVEVPANNNCLTVDFRFLSEEFPEYVGSSFNDAFIAELDTNDWSIGAGGAITANNNFAKDQSGQPITINTTGATEMQAEHAAGTTYDGATPLLQATTPVTPGGHSLYFSIFDQGDSVYDSAVFLDALTVGATAEEVCVAGATVPIAELDLTTSDPVTPPGVDDASLDDLPTDRIPQQTSATETAPIGRAPIGRAPIGRAPIGRAPIGRAPIGRAPIGRAPIGRAPIGRAPIGRAALAAYPLNVPGGWVAILEDSANYAGSTPQGVTMFQLFTDPFATDGNQGTLSQLDPRCAGAPGDTAPPAGCSAFAISLADINVAGSPMENVSLLSFLLGDLTWDDVTPPAQGWCAEWEAVSSIPCDTSRTIFDSEAEGVPLDLTSLPVRTVSDLLNDPNRSRATFWSLTLADLNIGYPWCSEPQCSSQTATLADLGPAIDDATLSDIVLMVMDPAGLEWESLPLVDAGFERFEPDEPTNFVDYTLGFDVGCDDVSGLQASVGLPPTFRYRPGSSSLRLGESEPSPIADPTESEGSLLWNLTVACGEGSERLEVDFQAMPGFTLGTFGASAMVQSDTFGPLTAADQAPVAVEDTHGAATNTIAGSANHLYVGYLDAGEKDFYDVSVPAGDTLSVTLSQLSVDYDLALYAPNGSDTAGLLRRPASVVPISTGALVTDPPALTDGILAPPALEGIHLEPGRVVSGISSLRGTEQEGISTAAVPGTGGSTTYRIQVAGHNGAFSDAPYVLIVRGADPYSIPECIANTLPSSGGSTTMSFPSATQAAGRETLYVVDEGALTDAFGAGTATPPTGALGIISSLTALASTLEGDGIVVPIDANAAANAALDSYRANSCSVEAANAAVRAVNDAVDSLADPASVRNVVLVGDDAFFPHAAIADGTVDGNEGGFTGDLVFGSASGAARSNHLTAVSAAGSFLSDTPYATPHPVEILGQVIYVPQWGFGRLTGNADDIIGAIARFDASDAAADPSSAVTPPRRVLETDYDFMTDGGQQIFERLRSQVGSGNAVRLFGNWSRGDFLSQFLQASNKPHVVAANAHYDQYRMLPGASSSSSSTASLVTTADVTAASGLAYRILFSIGCHFGLDVPEAYAPNAADAARRLDWAQAYAQEGVAAMIGNLGYGYGDIATIGFDERLMADLARNLDGSMSIGEGLNAATQTYFSSASALSPYDLKVLQQTTLWGLPMYSPTGPVSASSLATLAAPTPPAPDPDTGGLTTSSVSLSPTFTQRTAPDGHTFYEADGLTEALHPYPVMPKVVTALPGEAGLVAHGAVPLALTRTEEPIDIAFANATIDTAAIEPATAYETVYPVTGRIGTSVSATGAPAQNLVVIPAEFASDDDLSNSPSLGTFGKYPTSTWLVTYGPATGEFTPPEIRDVLVTPGASFLIEAQVTDGTGSGIKRVFAQVLKGDGSLARVELTGPAGGGLFSGTSNATAIRGVSVYAVDGHGNTAAAHDKQLGFVAVSDHGDVTKPTIQIFTPPAVPAIYDLNETVPEVYACSDDTDPAPTCTDSNAGPNLATSTPGAHVFTVTSRDASGNQATVSRTYFVRFVGFQGFFSPVDALPTVNSAKAGNSVPLKWRIVDANGQPITNASHFVSVTSTIFGSCSGVSDTIESYSGGSGLQYLGNGNWQFNWRTQKAWSGSCREVVLNLADGTPGGRGYVAARFSFK